MKRNLNEMRLLLQRIEKEPTLWVQVYESFKGDFGKQDGAWFLGYEPLKEGESIWSERTPKELTDAERASFLNLRDAGYIVLSESFFLPNGGPEDVSETYVRVTNAGHDFLESQKLVSKLVKFAGSGLGALITLVIFPSLVAWITAVFLTPNSVKQDTHQEILP